MFGKVSFMAPVVLVLCITGAEARSLRPLSVMADAGGDVARCVATGGAVDMSDQCVTFRREMNAQIASCMALAPQSGRGRSATAENLAHGYKALYLLCSKQTVAEMSASNE